MSSGLVRPSPRGCVGSPGKQLFLCPEASWAGVVRGMWQRTTGSLPVPALPSHDGWGSSRWKQERLLTPPTPPWPAALPAPDPGHVPGPSTEPGLCPPFPSLWESLCGVKGPGAQICSGPFVSVAPALPASPVGRRGGRPRGSHGWWQPDPCQPTYEDGKWKSLEGFFLQGGSPFPSAWVQLAQASLGLIPVGPQGPHRAPGIRLSREEIGVREDLEGDICTET